MQRLDRLVRLLSQPWAIERSVLSGWIEILDARLAGREVPAALADAGGEPELRAARSKSTGGGGDGSGLYGLEDGIAVVPVVGTLVKRNTAFSCDNTYGDVASALAAAQQERQAQAVLLEFETPGGTFAGLEAAGDLVFKAAQGGPKPVYGYVDDLAASAGYWLAAQTRKIGVRPSADVGSIGIVTVHYDRSARDEQYGVKRTVLAVGDMKAAGNDTGPLSPEARQYILEHLESSYGLFIGAVTRGRPQLTEEGIRGMQSRVYPGRQAHELGLVDHVMARDEYLDLIRSEVGTSVSVPANFPKGARMTLEELRAQHPDLVSQIEASARQGMIPQADASAAEASARTAGVEQERTRCAALLEARGPAPMILEAIQVGTEPGAYALSLLKAEREGKTAALDQLEESLAPTVQPAGAEKTKPGAQVVDFMQAAKAYQEKNGGTLAAAVKAVTKENPDLRAQYSEQARTTVTK